MDRNTKGNQAVPNSGRGLNASGSSAEDLGAQRVGEIGGMVFGADVPDGTSLVVIIVFVTIVVAGDEEAEDIS